MTTIDLSQILNERMPVYPGTEQPVFREATTIERDGFAEKLLSLYSHTGTHMDAPAHILTAAKSLDDFGIDTFIGRGRVLDATGLSGRISKKLVTAELRDSKGIDFLLIYTGWSAKWGEPGYFDDFPVCDDGAIRYIAERGLKGLGVDCISVDPVGSTEMPNHRALLSREMVIIENLCNLDKLMGRDFQFCCFPLKIENADGSPIRAVALVE